MRLQVLPFRYTFHGRHLYGVACRACSLVFVDPQPTPGELSALYSEEYFTACSATCGAHGPEAYMERAARGAVERAAWARRLDAMIQKHLARRGRLVEVGCGPGFLLAELRKLGWSVAGLEISAYAVRHAQDSLGIPVSQGSPASGSFAPHSVDVAFMGDVLEHLPDPLGALRAVREWLAPDGLVLIAVPSTLNLLSARLGMAAYQLLGRFKNLRIPPYHLFEYTPRTLRATITASGFQLLALQQSAVPVGRMALRGSVVENLGKASLQICALVTSRVLNRGGDRLLAVARPTQG